MTWNTWKHLERVTKAGPSHELTFRNLHIQRCAASLNKFCLQRYLQNRQPGGLSDPSAQKQYCIFYFQAVCHFGHAIASVLSNHNSSMQRSDSLDESSMPPFPSNASICLN